MRVKGSIACLLAALISNLATASIAQSIYDLSVLESDDTKDESIHRNLIEKEAFNPFSLSLDNNYTKCPTRKPKNGQFCERPSKWKCYYGKSCQDERNKKCNRKTECVCKKGKFECTSSTTCHKCTKIWKECPDFKPSKLDKCDLGGKCIYAQFECHKGYIHTCVCDDKSNKVKKKFKCEKEKCPPRN
jgi:hypothetical protein